MSVTCAPWDCPGPREDHGPITGAPQCPADCGAPTKEETVTALFNTRHVPALKACLRHEDPTFILVLPRTERDPPIQAFWYSVRDDLRHLKNILEPGSYRDPIDVKICYLGDRLLVGPRELLEL